MLFDRLRRFTMIVHLQILNNRSVKGHSAAMYGMIASLPNRGNVNEIVLDLLDGLTCVEAQAPKDFHTSRVE